MYNDKSRLSPDSSRININQLYEVDYWCQKLDCTKEQLEEAVKKVGSSAQEVRRYFNK